MVSDVRQGSHTFEFRGAFQTNSCERMEMCSNSRVRQMLNVGCSIKMSCCVVDKNCH